MFDYTVQEGDSDITGGITLGAFNRNNAALTDAAGNRFLPPTDLAETANTLAISADSTAPTLASIRSDDRGILNSGAVSDTLTFKFNELTRVDTLENAFASGKVNVTSADGSVVRKLGAGASVEATYPSSIELTGFNAKANGSYTSLWSPSQGKNISLPNFSGFAFVAGSNLTPDGTFPAYQHTDSDGQTWYLWRPSGFASYVLTPLGSELNGAAQTWWSTGTGPSTVDASSPREGVLLASDWFSRSGTATMASKLSVRPSLEATGAATSYTLALGTGNDVQQGDKLVIDKSGIADLAGNSPGADLSLSLSADITRPVWQQALVKGMKFNAASSNHSPTTDTLTQGDLIRVEIPVSETVFLYYSGGSAGYVTLDVGGQTRQAALNLAASSTNGTTAFGLSSNTLVFDYLVQAGDADSQGGTTVGAMNRGVGIYDAAGNRPTIPVDVQEAANTVTVASGTVSAPSVWVSYASGSTVILTSDQPLDTLHLPSLNAFSATVNGTAMTVAGLSAIAGQPNSLALTLAVPLSAGQTVNISYTDPSSGDDLFALQNFAGMDTAWRGGSTTVSAAPSIRFAHTDGDLIQVTDAQNGNEGIYFTLAFTESVLISGSPRLAISLVNGSTTKTVYANFKAYDNNGFGQTPAEFVYTP